MKLICSYLETHVFLSEGNKVLDLCIIDVPVTVGIGLTNAADALPCGEPPPSATDGLSQLISADSPVLVSVELL